MLRYSTPIIEIETDINLADLTALWVSFRQDSVILRKTKEQVKIEGTILKVRLSQEDTAMFKADNIVEVQIRWLTENGSASGSNIASVVFGRVLEEEVISVEGSN